MKITKKALTIGLTYPIKERLLHFSKVKKWSKCNYTSFICCYGELYSKHINKFKP